ncbi:MAG: flavin reductase family protein [Ktedonobacterales bacterium]
MSALPESAEGSAPGDDVITTERYKDLLAQLAGAVAVITTRDAEALNWGFTASSFCSLSLEPPLVLFCLSHDADCAAAFAATGNFAVSILTARQVELSQRFAGKGDAKYAGVRFATGALGMPLLPGALVWLECRVVARYPGGDHTIVVGQVERGDMAPADGDGGGAGPLLYYDRGYGAFTTGEGVTDDGNGR